MAPEEFDPRAVVRKDIELFAQGREAIDALLTCFAKDCVFRDCTSDTIHLGRDGLRDYTLAIYDALPDLKVENLRLIAEGSTVVAEMEFVGTHVGRFMEIPGTGRRLRWRTCTVYDVNAHNEIARETYYFDSAGLRAQMTDHRAEQ